MARYQKLKNAIKGTEEHKEKMLLVYLIQNFESNHYPLSEVDPIEMIKIRMKEFGFNSAMARLCHNIHKHLTSKDKLKCLMENISIVKALNSCHPDKRHSLSVDFAFFSDILRTENHFFADRY